VSPRRDREPYSPRRDDRRNRDYDRRDRDRSRSPDDRDRDRDMKEGRDRDDEIKHDGPNGDDRKGLFSPIPKKLCWPSPLSRMVNYLDLMSIR